MSENKTGRGGAREGAGRKPEYKKKKVQITAHISEDTKAQIKQEMKKAKLPTIGRMIDLKFKRKK